MDYENFRHVVHKWHYKLTKVNWDAENLMVLNALKKPLNFIRFNLCFRLLCTAWRQVNIHISETSWSCWPKSFHGIQKCWTWVKPWKEEYTRYVRKRKRRDLIYMHWLWGNNNLFKKVVKSGSWKASKDSELLQS